jgi:CcmD family protein
MRRRPAYLLVLIAFGFLAVLPPSYVLAQPPTPAAGQAPQAQGSQDEFVPVKTLPAQDQIPAATLVMAAYGFVWALLLVYVWTVWRRLMKVEREMQELSSRLGQKR